MHFRMRTCSRGTISLGGKWDPCGRLSRGGFCQYLIGVINACPEFSGLALTNHDKVVLKLRCVGSRHFKLQLERQWRLHVDVQKTQKRNSRGSKRRIHLGIQNLWHLPFPLLPDLAKVTNSEITRKGMSILFKL